MKEKGGEIKQKSKKKGEKLNKKQPIKSKITNYEKLIEEFKVQC